MNAKQIIQAAVNKAIANGSPVIVEQPTARQRINHLELLQRALLAANPRLHHDHSADPVLVKLEDELYALRAAEIVAKRK